MNIKGRILLILCLQLCVMSCKDDFLDVPDKTVLLKEAYVKNIATLNDYLRGIYVGLAGEYFDGQYALYPDVVADNVKPVEGGFLSSHYLWEQSVLGANINVLWQVGYRLIHDCDFVIEKSDEYNREDKTKSETIKGQALVLRAYIHLSLVNLFAQPYSYTENATHAGIPYILASDRGTQVSRQSVKDVYDNITRDLNLALSFLPKENKSNKVVNYLTAEALLARAYLFEGHYLEAKNLAISVLGVVPIMQNGYPEKLYTDLDEEALFLLSPGSYGTNGYTSIFSGYYLGSGIFYATNDIAELLKQNPLDKRNAWVTLDPSTNNWIVNKFPQGVTGMAFSPAGDYYHTLVRSSEMALIAAEACANLNKEDSARFYVNLIRNRANVSSLLSSGPELKDSIYLERRKELSFEGIRMFDLLRWKKGIHRQDALSDNARELSYPNSKAIAPIPQQDVDILHFEQNPGY